MNLGSFHTRFDGWRRAPATLLLLGLVAVLLIALWPVASSPQPKMRASEAEQSDLQLYRDISVRVSRGEGYYPVAAEELRRGGYPLKPFFTFRLPTLTLVYAHFAEITLIIVEGLLALAVLAVWWRRLEPHLPLRMLGLALVLMVGGTATLVEPVTGMFHESWAALLMALMIGLRRPSHAAWAIVAGGLALLVRETALPMILTMGGLAAIERRWREAMGWAAVVGLFALAMLYHFSLVAAVVRPEDLESPGWNALLGARFALSAFSMVSSATALPKGLAAAVILLSLFGWASVKTQWALRVSLLLLGYGAMLAIFARADTFYWALLVAPLSLVGLIFVPRALAELVRSARGVRDAEI
ncbi:MAG TPA: hypothetical protein VNI79_08540 [Sphingomicrobium sp.]|nr:hypothetical protein [Sphingomicrobium sp.]